MEHIDESGAVLLLGCGILKKETEWLIRKYRWNLETRFFSSSLHIHLNKLENTLTGGLNMFGERPVVVLYGCCHPRIDRLMKDRRACRTPGQNCVEILLGRERFARYLEEGAFFILEDWARNWDDVMGQAFGDNMEVRREIFQSEHRFFLALRTPCSEDFSAEAESISHEMGLPLKWLDVSLDNLERILRDTMEQVRKGGSSHG